MDGMPVMTSTRKRIQRASRPPSPYSTRKIDVSSPIGTEITVAAAVISRVPMMAW